MKRSHLAREIIEILVLTLVIFLVIRYVIQSYQVNGTTMQPTLTTDEQVVVNKVAYWFHMPERGDVIVFHNPHNVGTDLIERIIGIPGDTITTDSTTVQLNGKLLHEPYVKLPTNPAGMTLKVPAGQYFVMNDNRDAQDDSRYQSFGLVPKEYIVGKAVMVFWPLGKMHFIDAHPEVFKPTNTQPQHPNPKSTPTPAPKKK